MLHYCLANPVFVDIWLLLQCQCIEKKDGNVYCINEGTRRNMADEI